MNDTETFLLSLQCEYADWGYIEILDATHKWINLPAIVYTVRVDTHINVFVGKDAIYIGSVDCETYHRSMQTWRQGNIGAGLREFLPDHLLAISAHFHATPEPTGYTAEGAKRRWIQWGRKCPDLNENGWMLAERKSRLANTKDSE